MASQSKDTVSVACKLPHGLLMRIYTPVDVQVPVLGGGTRTETQYKYLPGKFPEFRLKGFSHHQNQAPSGEIVNGYAVTHGIPKDFWDEWMKQNHEADFVKNNLVFAQPTAEALGSQMRDKDHAKLKSGLERIDPANLKGKIQTSDLMKGRSNDNEAA